MGRVFDIQHFSTGDGPGIRTTVFFKGCPLHCLWCHNPESQKPYPQVFYNPAKCIGCGRCERACPEGQERRHSVECADACPTGCLERVGREWSTEEVLREVLKDKAFYDNSDGGMTLSGGEPLAQPAFALELLSAAKDAGVHTAIETSGCGKTADYMRLMPVTDLFLWDIKVMNKELYERYVGGGFEAVVENLRTLHKAGATLRLRLLYIPELHDRPDVLAATRALLREFESVPYDVIPYHPYGNSKRERLDLEKITFTQPSEQQVWEYGERLKATE